MGWWAGGRTGAALQMGSAWGFLLPALPAQRGQGLVQSHRALRAQAPRAWPAEPTLVGAWTEGPSGCVVVRSPQPTHRGRNSYSHLDLRRLRSRKASCRSLWAEPASHSSPCFFPKDPAAKPSPGLVGDVESLSLAGCGAFFALWPPLCHFSICLPDCPSILSLLTASSCSVRGPGSPA